jgi:hypothetical protein
MTAEELIKELEKFGKTQKVKVIVGDYIDGENNVYDVVGVATYNDYNVYLDIEQIN